MSDVAVLTVNGAPLDLEPGCSTLADLVSSWCESIEGIAVAVNGEVVPRSEWSARTLEAGDRVEIVTAVAGG